MIELTLGAIAAALIARALNRAEEKAVDESEGALRQLVEFVRGRLFGIDDEKGSAALERVKDAPDSPSRVEGLARLLDERADSEPEFRHELKTLVEEAQGAGVDVEGAVQSAFGSQIVQNSNVSDSEINIFFGSSSQPRRITD